MKTYGLLFNYDGNKQKGFIVYDKDFNKVIGAIHVPSGKKDLVFVPDTEYIENGNSFTHIELNDIVIFISKNNHP